MKFGRLTFIRSLPAPKGFHPRAVFSCDCGNTTTTRLSSVLTGKVKSCGCLQRETVKELRTDHGLTGSRTYKIWAGMRQRCNNPRNRRYYDYGGRGIAVCDSWSRFNNFLKDMGECPSDKHSIDRIDNDGNYCPENCRWITLKRQVLNKRSTIHVPTPDGDLCLKDYCKLLGVDYSSVRYRLSTGMSLEEAVTKPSQRRMWRKKKIK